MNNERPAVVTVRIPTMFRRYTGGRNVVECAGRTLGGLLCDLDNRYPGLSGAVAPGGHLRRFLTVYVNDRRVAPAGALQAAIWQGDTVTMLPALDGGALGFAAAAALLGSPTRG